MALGDHAAHLDIDGSYAAEELLDRLKGLWDRRPADAPASTSGATDFGRTATLTAERTNAQREERR